MKTKQLSGATILLSFVILLASGGCKNEKQAEGTDKLLYDMAKETTGFTWYKKSDALLNTTSGSGHSFPFLRTRYNQIAAAKLNDNGQIIAGSTFPEGSVIVKEFHDDSRKLARYAILYKASDNSDADSKGWVWGYINADGTVAQESGKKGSGCNECHNQSGNIDYMLMNKYFP
ncbi:MAG: hypothetical protein A2X06_13435 [Bacteroidetes bacterium GWC2_40_22]|nr:MAG: hypothetical protein A2X06_13435 [Bacteroidetes bacterium GWC2_40_22]